MLYIRMAGVVYAPRGTLPQWLNFTGAVNSGGRETHPLPNIQTASYVTCPRIRTSDLCLICTIGSIERVIDVVYLSAHTI